jgi:ABC-type microcin C transport system permease subunit YejB
MIFRNYFFMVRRMVVQLSLLGRLATVSVLLEAGGKPFTWFPLEGLVEPTFPPQYSRDDDNREFI